MLTYCVPLHASRLVLCSVWLPTASRAYRFVAYVLSWLALVRRRRRRRAFTSCRTNSSRLFASGHFLRYYRVSLTNFVRVLGNKILLPTSFLAEYKSHVAGALVGLAVVCFLIGCIVTYFGRNWWLKRRERDVQRALQRIIVGEQRGTPPPPAPTGARPYATAPSGGPSAATGYPVGY